jgi:hypothetical protein
MNNRTRQLGANGHSFVERAGPLCLAGLVMAISMGAGAGESEYVSDPEKVQFVEDTPSPVDPPGKWYTCINRPFVVDVTAEDKDGWRNSGIERLDHDVINCIEMQRSEEDVLTASCELDVDEVNHYYGARLRWATEKPGNYTVRFQAQDAGSLTPGNSNDPAADELSDATQITVFKAVVHVQSPVGDERIVLDADVPSTAEVRIDVQPDCADVEIILQISESHGGPVIPVFFWDAGYTAPIAEGDVLTLVGQTPGYYTITPKWRGWECGDPVEGIVYDVEWLIENLEILRSEGKVIQMKMEPLPAALADIKVEVSGFDDVHWTAYYNRPFHRIDYTNLIEMSSPICWLDEQIMDLSAGFEDVDNVWTLSPTILFKKGMWALRDYIVEEGEDLLETIDPVTQAVDLLRMDMMSIYAYDEYGNRHEFLTSRIDEVEESLETYGRTYWCDAITTVWDAVPVEEFEGKIVDESWHWEWNLAAEIHTAGFPISIEFDDGRPAVGVPLYKVIDSWNDHGFDDCLKTPHAYVFEAEVSADGKVGRLSLAFSVGVEYKYYTRFYEPIVEDYVTGYKNHEWSANLKVGFGF